MYDSHFSGFRSIVHPEVAYSYVSAAFRGWLTLVNQRHARHVVLVYGCWLLWVALGDEDVSDVDELVR